MKTSLTCPGCHRRYEVDERFTGKTLKCAHCETSMRVPAAEPDAPPEQPAFGEYELGETRASAATTFRAPRTRSDLEPSRGQSRGRGKKKKAARRGGRGDRSRQPAESILANPSVLITLAAIAVVVALLGYFVPSAKRFAGVVLCCPDCWFSCTVMQRQSTSRSQKTIFTGGCFCYFRFMRLTTL